MSDIFSQSCSYENSKLVLLGVPWEVTASYAGGTASGPRWIQKASSQLDFFDPQTQQDASKKGIHFLHLSELKNKNDQLRPLFHQATENKDASSIHQINQGCANMVETVQQRTQQILDDGKQFGLLGGDHSVSEGAILEIARRYKNDFGILHLDAHADLRKSYQNLKHSHASVMYNILPYTSCLVQVGVRDLCEEEYQRICNTPHIHCFFEYQIQAHLFQGGTFHQIVEDIINQLPSYIYISIDIDALSWSYAPHTGCPVPEGLSFAQTQYLLNQLSQKKRNIIGFDITEVAKPASNQFGEWDGNVGARLTYQLCQLSLFQNTHISK